MPLRASAPCCHQEANDVGPPLEYRMVQGPMLVVSRHIEVDQLGTHHEHRPDAIDVTGAHGVAEAADRHAVDERLQFGPALEAVGSRDHELGVVQREARGIRSVVLRVDLRRGVGFAGGKRLKQFLRLTFELDQVGFVAQRATGRVFPRGHRETPFVAAHSQQPAPGVRLLGQKRVHGSDRTWTRFRRTQSFPRTRKRPDARLAAYPRDVTLARLQ